jgi:hypothetical protein
MIDFKRLSLSIFLAIALFLAITGGGCVKTKYKYVKGDAEQWHQKYVECKESLKGCGEELRSCGNDLSDCSNNIDE